MKTVIFDFDGTIADSRQMIMETANIILKDMGRDELTHADVQKAREMTIPQLLKYFKIPTHLIPRIAIRARKMISERIDQVPPIKGINDVIIELKKQGYELGILSSNTKSNINTFLKNNKLDEYFEFVDAGAGIVSKKSRLKQTLRRHKIEAKSCAYVGDEIKDVVAAKTNLVKSIAVDWGLNTAETLSKYGPGAIVTNPSQILESL